MIYDLLGQPAATVAEALNFDVSKIKRGSRAESIPRRGYYTLKPSKVELGFVEVDDTWPLSTVWIKTDAARVTDGERDQMFPPALVVGMTTRAQADEMFGEPFWTGGDKVIPPLGYFPPLAKYHLTPTCDIHLSFPEGIVGNVTYLWSAEPDSQ